MEMVIHTDTPRLTLSRGRAEPEALVEGRGGAMSDTGYTAVAVYIRSASLMTYYVITMLGKNVCIYIPFTALGMHSHTQKYMFYTHIYIYICIYIYMYIYIYIYTYIYTYIYINIHTQTCIHTYIHTYVCT